MRSAKLISTGAEDRALQGWNLSADFGAETGPGALCPRLVLTLYPGSA